MERTGRFFCDQNYIGETARNAETRWNEYEDKNIKTVSAKHLQVNATYKLTWTFLSKALETFCKGGVFIKIIFPTLHEQLENKLLTLLTNSIAYM